MKKNCIITLKVAVIEVADPEVVAEAMRKGIEFINPILKPEIVELSAERVVRLIIEENEVE